MAIEPLEPRLLLEAGPLIISEFLAVNNGGADGSGLADKDGEYSDWIEIHNPSGATVDLDGWYLTDDARDLRKWQFPAVPLAAEDYLIVFASGKDEADPAELHTSFRLDSDGEYLALVAPDGTVAHQYSPAFLEQFEDVSYGMTQDVGSFALPEGAELTYRVPTGADAPLGTAWAALDFDDSTWSGLLRVPRILISEVGTGDDDYVEVQNVSANTVDTTGWVVAVNNARDGINGVHGTLWTLPSLTAADEVLYQTDNEEDAEHYWNENIWWSTAGDGWAMILDDRGAVADFVIWGYDAADVASLDVTVNGFQVTAKGAWAGAAVPAEGNRDNSLKRRGSSDHDDNGDWAFTEPPSLGDRNAQLSTPFVVDVSAGIGFDVDGSGLAGAIGIDVAEEMHGSNASLWVRIPFEVDNPTAVSQLRLRIRYNDGFVAYLNGREVARGNAPGSLQWDSAAGAARSVEESLVPEEIDASQFRDVLVAGINVVAIHGLNAASDDGNFLILPELVGSSTLYFDEPTPGAPNVDGFMGFVEDTRFSVDRGIFQGAMQVEISTDTPGATIVYTTDGSIPSLGNGTEVPNPAGRSPSVAVVDVSGTTILRAAALKENYQPTNVDTQTYVFPADVVRQSTMSGAITNHPVWGPQLQHGLTAIPTVSLATPYTLSQSERETSMELIFPDGTNGFQVDAGVEIFGGHSLNYPKKPLRISFKSEYGPPRLHFDLFGDGAAGEFDQILLKSGSHDTVFYENGTKGIYIRNRWIWDRHLEMGQPAPHGFYVHLYVNGRYEGQYQLAERPNAAFMASYLGGEKEDYAALNAGTPVGPDPNRDGRVSWDAMAGATNNYEALQQHMDVANYADYMLLQFYCGNDWDWNTWQNWMAAGNRQPPGAYKFFAWDSDMILRRGLNANVINRGGPGNLWSSVKQHEEFRMLLADRAQRYFFNDGILTPGRVLGQFDELTAEMEQSIIAETARWGGGSYTPATWQQHVNIVKTQIIAQRTEVVVQQMRDAGVFPQTDAPSFSQHGGEITPGFELTMEAPAGTIYYTLDGTDPRAPGGNMQGMPYTGPIVLGESTLVKARALDGGEWSALNEAKFELGGLPLAGQLVITELNYNPHDPSPEEQQQELTDNEDFEFLEMQNIGQTPIDLTGLQFTDAVQFQFTSTLFEPKVLITEVATGSDDYLEIQNVSSTAINTSGWMVAINDSIADDVNEVNPTLWALPAQLTAGQVLYRTDDVDDHYWGEGIRWRTSGTGWAMILDNQGHVADFLVWGFTPSDLAALDVDISGFHLTADGAWSGPPVAAEGTYSNSLQRIGASDHDTAADFLFTEPQSKGSRNAGLMIPFGAEPVELGPGQFVVVAGNVEAFAARYGTEANVAGQYTGRLSNAGERVILASPLGQTVFDFQYDDGGRWPGRADGRGAALELVDPRAVPLSEPERSEYLAEPGHWRSSVRYGGTPGAEPAPQVGVVVNEVLTHTDDPLLDAIELFNTTDAAVDLGGWYVSDSSNQYRKYCIPAGTTIPAAGYLVFDEDDFNPTPLEPGPNDFALSGAHGDDVWLMKADAAGNLTDFADHVEFGAAPSGESFGRWPNGTGRLYPMVTPTLDPEHGQNSGPRIGPVVFSEVMYHPADPGGGVDVDDVEFVEIYNPTGQTVELTDWQLADAVEYDFPAGTLLAPHATLVVVPFDLNETDTLATFRSHYGLSESVLLLGGYSGRLRDEGERVQLLRPDEPPPDEPSFIPHVIEDEVCFDDQPPWPAGAGGSGASLVRQGAGLWGNDASSWTTSDPTPGEFQSAAQTVGRYVFYNHSAFDGDDAAAGPQDDQSVAPDKVALLPGQTATFANYTSYSRGINGIMVDVAGLPAGGGPGADDFIFRVGNTNDPSAWAMAPAPASITVRRGMGTGGSDRVTLVWPDESIQQGWLQVTVLAGAATGLSRPEVFYFGNAIGESGNQAGDAMVNAADVLAARDNPRSFLNPAPIDLAYDYNRDARVNATDMLLARNHPTHFLSALKLVTAPAETAGIFSKKEL